MSKTKESFDAILETKNIPAHYEQIDGGHHLYRLRYNVSEERSLVVECIIQNRDDDYSDAQLIYRFIHLLGDRSKEGIALKTINELNAGSTGYYNLFLAGDGEIMLRSLLRVGPDARPLYETMVAGSAIAKAMIPELVNDLGPTAPIQY